MKKFMAVLLAGLVLMSIFSTAFAGCNHRWRGWINYDKNPPTCQKAGQQVNMCTVCKVHIYRDCNKLPCDYQPAKCEEKPKCRMCHGDMPNGKVKQHSWKSATCVSLKTCNDCGKQEGELGNHVLTCATCEQRATCIYCGNEFGGYASHIYINGDVCYICGHHK